MLNDTLKDLMNQSRQKRHKLLFIVEKDIDHLDQLLKVMWDIAGNEARKKLEQFFLKFGYWYRLKMKAYAIGRLNF
ncbi:hypothetical protein [Thermicanus aegyptius]|uniref:hypothetical protein n=1 Tax=Thermicanus aegyptius TaxID=94009 RepID=UPI00041F1427|nr:hypothetical protein [Thermicanus aegyptius]